MKRIKYWSFLLSILLFVGCSKEELPVEEEDEGQASEQIQKINTFIKTVMTDVYLWYDKVPNIDIKYETDPVAYFYKLLYSEDKWSFITDDITALTGSIQGVETSYGYSLVIGRFVDNTGTPTGTFFAVVEYVYPDTPASRAGFKRGDIIVGINGGDITVSNYYDLFSSISISITKGILTGQGIAPGTTVNLVAQKLNLDPVLIYKIIEISGHKIGYLMYLQYISSYNQTSLDQALGYFNTNHITDLVLDLRYNPGGELAAARYLCSSIAPMDAIENNKVLITFQWNNKYMSFWTSNDMRDQIEVNFDPGVLYNLDLSRLYVLTGYGTASASELTICGLEPYMDLTLIGDTTYGKYTASITITPEDYYSDENDYSGFKNWGIQPIVARFANSQGVTNFKNGFAPDFYAKDELLPAYPLGELSEPLLRKAVEDITGEPVSIEKKGKLPFEFEVFYRGSSLFDQQKRNLYIEVSHNPRQIR